MDLHTRAKGILMLPPVAGMWLATSHFSETTLDLSCSTSLLELKGSHFSKWLLEFEFEMR